MLSLPATRRVRRKKDFEAAYQKGLRLGDSRFSMTVRPNDLGHPRIGLAIAARTVGKAVARNRVRRIIRESFRLAQHRLPPADIIVGARAGARDATAATLRASLDALWNKVALRCASSSAP